MWYLQEHSFIDWSQFGSPDQQQIKPQHNSCKSVPQGSCVPHSWSGSLWFSSITCCCGWLNNLTVGPSAWQEAPAKCSTCSLNSWLYMYRRRIVCPASTWVDKNEASPHWLVVVYILISPFIFLLLLLETHTLPSMIPQNKMKKLLITESKVTSLSFFFVQSAVFYPKTHHLLWHDKKSSNNLHLWRHFVWNH